ncbi:serine hydrolase domain-containing protein [Paraglaciecola hydrolytica]|uniref:Serine hydrolase n=1 Tax=Paraglaciecola hydrolytica TaxID=1799789 RepID=A0A135ZZ03_9ALTE|nr:serine hydrolase domain-containing protein [Paraglaciecola hydrolytica]KXI28213.1 serine hydrolase [Paraglaciecola hydrolytica]
MSKKKQVFRIVLLSATIISMFFVPWVLVKAWILPLPATVQAQVDEAIGHGLDGMIVYVDKAGQPPEFYAAGWHDRDIQIPANPHALFKIASISKLYDAVAITKLISAKRLSLDGTLAEYFPELVGRIEYADKITLGLMVQHRSGIPNLTESPDFWSNPPNSSEEALALVLDKPANFKPDADYEYSNTNYLLISELINKVLAYDNFQYYQQEILEPLGLQHTFGSINDVNLDDVMSGYYVGIEEDLKASEYGSRITSMIASAQDVGIFLRALNDGSVFAEGEREIYSSIYVYEHTGWVPGYQSIAKYHQDIDTVVIQFNNTTGGYHWNTAEIVYNRIVKILHRELKHE